MVQVIRSPTTSYVIADLQKSKLAVTATYTVYLVTDEADGSWYMLKVPPPGIPGNGRLDREALVLKDIQAEVERIRATEKPDATGGALRFEKCFPRLHESFLFTEQGDRRINVIEIPATDMVTDLFALEQWRIRNEVRIDPKSSAWLMARLLKVFTLTHPIGISVGKIDGGNILVNPKKHRALFFDWTEAHQYPTYVPPEKVGEEIADAAKQVFLALGGSLAKGTLPASDQLTDGRYAKLLLQFMSGVERDPDKAYDRFYKLVREMWEPEFHTFTTIPM
jgi:hypothetical protein